MEKYWAHLVISNTEEWEGDVFKADEVNEIIMNMVDEFAETAKEYETELAKKDEEISRLRKAIREIEYLADRITVENESIAKAIIKLAHEALAEKEGE